MGYFNYSLDLVKSRTRSSGAEQAKRPNLANVDARRMSAVLDAPTVQVPAGLTREQLRSFILSHAKKA